MEKTTLLGKTFETCCLDLFGANLMIIKGAKGFLACGYINIATAEKLGSAAASVSGVKNYADMLNAKVVALTSAARNAGCKEGMTGAQILEILA